MSEPCAFCGGEHEPGPVGEPGSWLEGVEFKVCPEIPPEHFYEDREFEVGPNGALHRVFPESA